MGPGTTTKRDGRPIGIPNSTGRLWTSVVERGTAERERGPRYAPSAWDDGARPVQRCRFVRRSSMSGFNRLDVTAVALVRPRSFHGEGAQHPPTEGFDLMRVPQVRGYQQSMRSAPGTNNGPGGIRTPDLCDAN